MVIHRWYFHSPFRGIMTKNNPINRSKLGPKRHILTDKEGIPLSVVIFSASTRHRAGSRSYRLLSSQTKIIIIWTKKRKKKIVTPVS